MANIIDYVRNATDSFSDAPLNRVDSLVFSWLAYVRYPDDSPTRSLEGQDLSEAFGNGGLTGLTAAMHDPRHTEELLVAVAESPRFCDVVGCLHSEQSSRKAEKQFSAITFRLPGGGSYVAYRGTDNTLVGWKENFNMAFQTAIPSQTTSTSYLALVAEQLEGPIWVGGHSKGGNLAVYATMTVDAEVRERVKRCYTHDGPGFTDEMRSDARWAGAYELVDKTIPEGSLIGLIFESRDVEMQIVRSTNSGIMQHAPFSWEVEGNDFAVERAISYDSYRTIKRLDSWLDGMGADERERFVEILYKLVQASGEVTFGGLKQSLADGSLKLMLSRLDGMPEDDRKFFMDAAEELVATMLLGPAPANPKTAAEKVDAAGDAIDDITARFNDKLSKLEKYGD